MIELRRRYSGGKGSDSPSFSRLPAGYQEVEYLENTESQYIDLDLSLPNGFIFESYVNVISKRGDYGVVLGCHEISAPYKRNFLTFPHVSSNGYSIGCGDNSYTSGYSKYNDRVKIKASTLIGNNYLFINDNLYVENDYIGERSGRNIYLFASNNIKQFGASQFFRGTIEEAKIYDEHEELVRHLIPCYRTSDRVAGMYDIVNDVFYTNAGTGEFLVGADVGGGNVNIEYLTAIDVTGGSITTDWIPQAGAIVKWDCILSKKVSAFLGQSYFRTVPVEDSEHRSFSANNGANNISYIYCWLQYSYEYGAISPFSIYVGNNLDNRVNAIWDSGVGIVTFGDQQAKLGNIKTDTSGYPLELFCGNSQQVVIYGVELINQESEGGQTYTLRPARKDRVIGLYCEETGVFLSSDNGVEFTIYEE